MEGVDFNQDLKACLDIHGYDRNKPVEERMAGFDFRSASICALNGRVAMYMIENEATRAFLKSNPQFRYPGGSNGNYDPCWGRNKRYVEGRC